MNTAIRGILPEEASIHTADMTAIIIALKEIYKNRRQKIGNILKLSEFYVVHQIQQRKVPDDKSDILYPSRIPKPR